jgi:asparagine synthase (glutamine-hydrolysing)
LFAGYDVFREAKVRRFWARQPASRWRPLLLERLYPYLERSPVAHRAIARHYFGQDLASWRSPGFGHGPRWRGAAALQCLFSGEIRSALAGRDAVRELLDTLPPAFARWAPLAQDQYLEIRTLLSGYLLSSQGDRMLMAHSVEARFPFLDPRLAGLASSLPPGYMLRGLDEKHVLKKAARGTVPPEILERPKQPYRAPDALSFLDPSAREWIEEVASLNAIRGAGVFGDRARRVLDKCLASHAGGQYSNADNMAVVGILSTQLLHDRLIRRRPDPGSLQPPERVIDRVAAKRT